MLCGFSVQKSFLTYDLLVVSLLKATGLRANVTEGLEAYYPFSVNAVDETGNN